MCALVVLSNKVFIQLTLILTVHCFEHSPIYRHNFSSPGHVCSHDTHDFKTVELQLDRPLLLWPPYFMFNVNFQAWFCNVTKCVCIFYFKSFEFMIMVVHVGSYSHRNCLFCFDTGFHYSLLNALAIYATFATSIVPSFIAMSFRFTVVLGNIENLVKEC